MDALLVWSCSIFQLQVDISRISNLEKPQEEFQHTLRKKTTSNLQKYINSNLVGGITLSEKYAQVKLDHFSKFRDEHKNI